MTNRVLATGLAQPEGPAISADGSIYLVEMDESRECVTRINAHGARHVFSRPGGRPTGLAFDGDGCLWAAGGPGNSLVQLAPDGTILKTITGDDRGDFLFPNDLAFGPDGHLYMTDSGMRPADFIQGLAIRPDFYAADYDGCVFEIEPRSGRVLRRLASGLRFANGIAFDANGVLYANESLTGLIHRFTPLDSGLRMESFANVLIKPGIERFIGPDGMAFDVEGRLYCAVYGQGDVTVVSARGDVIQRIASNGQLPTNVAFVANEAGLLITEVERGALEYVPVEARGLHLHRPSLA